MTQRNTDFPLLYEAVDRDMARVLAEKTDAERLQIGWGMWRAARRMIARIVAAESPELSASEIERETARRLSQIS